ncbi:MAG: MATE family efflux transporter [Erysipelotrichaceae bacterium]|nr:MATE family efflux transporter [Erysipelotrichaceae bacterium]
MIKEAFRMAWPAVLESFFVSLAGMIDTLMISSLGPSAVAGVGLTTQPKFIALTIFIAINIGISALVARRYGQKNQHSANEIVVTALVFTLIACVIITTITVLGADTIIRWCGSNADTHDAGSIYFKVIQLGMIFNVLSLAINAAQRGSGNTKIAMTTNITSSIVNIIFNYLLIGGNLGFPKWGVFGAAFATVLGTFVACVMSIRSIFKKQSYISFKYIVDNKIRFQMDTFKSLINLSSNFIIENLVMRIGFLTTAIMAAKLGTEAFAAHQVGMNFLNLSFSFGDGMQVAAVALIGRSLGAKDGTLAKAYGSICQKMGLGISLVLMVVLFGFGREIFSIFFTEANILDMGSLIMNFIAITSIFQISQIIFAGALRGAGDAKFTLLGSLISVTIIRTLVTWGLSGGLINLGLVGIWTGVLSDQLSRFLLFSTRYRRGKWINIEI